MDTGFGEQLRREELKRQSRLRFFRRKPKDVFQRLTTDRKTYVHEDILVQNNHWTLCFLYLNAMYYSFPADPPITFQSTYKIIQDDRERRNVSGAPIKRDTVLGKMRELKLEWMCSLFESIEQGWGISLIKLLGNLSSEDLFENNSTFEFFGLPNLGDSTSLIKVSRAEWLALTDPDFQSFIPLDLPGDLADLFTNHIPQNVLSTVESLEKYKQIEP